VAWAIYAVLADPEVEARLRTELDAALGGAAVADDAALGRCPYLRAVVQETLRLHSPAGFAGRKAQADIAFAGHTVRRGTMVLYSQHVTHRDPELWPDPCAFDPSRWIDADGGLVDPDPYAFVPFGGGYRRCIGFAVATLEAQLILAAVVQRTRLRLDRFPIDPTGIAAVEPKGGVPVRVLEVLGAAPTPP
jgi:cytochrome P450